MKATFHLLFFLFISFLGNDPARKQVYLLDPYRTDVVTCSPAVAQSTLNAYIQEASQLPFAGMHPSPKKIHYDQQVGSMIRFTVSDGLPANGYYIPAKKPSKRWLIIIQEWWGLNDQIKAEADKYHEDLENMHILAVDMYDGKVASTPDSAMKLTRGADVKRMTSIIQGAIAHAGTDASIYSVGWCFGGMWSLQTAILADKQAKGSVMFYGRPETNIDKLRSIQCDILGFFGNLDRSPSPEMVNEFEKNMQLAGRKLTTFKYEAGHGFANPSNPSFNVTAAKDTYDKAIAFFRTH
jgi:carboxymethylenebutenolidase